VSIGEGSIKKTKQEREKVIPEVPSLGFFVKAPTERHPFSEELIEPA
jgi:hypothetical protein